MTDALKQILLLSNPNYVKNKHKSVPQLRVEQLPLHEPVPQPRVEQLPHTINVPQTRLQASPSQLHIAQPAPPVVAPQPAAPTHTYSLRRNR